MDLLLRKHAADIDTSVKNAMMAESIRQAESEKVSDLQEEINTLHGIMRKNDQGKNRLNFLS